MGIVGAIKLAVKCVDVLAWHLFALVYPLCASVHAIESGSSSATSKLVVYWVLFSLLFLFEHAFGKLLQWIPFWPYIKLIIFCWLVIPNFNGAFYAYKHLLRPCLYMDTKVLINQLKEKIEFFFKKNEFEAEVKKCLKENGPKSPEELVGSKDLDAVKVRSANFVQKDVKTVEEVIERKDLSVVKMVYLTEHELAQTQNKNFAPKKLKETLKTVALVTEFPEIPVSNKVQKWTCPLCQVTTGSVTTLNSHLEGQRHKAALEKLKTKNEPSKMVVWEKAKNQPAKKAACEEVEAKNQPAKRDAYEEVKVETKVPPASEHKASGLPVQKPKDSSSSSQKLQCQQGNKYKCVEQREVLWWCTICNVSCTCMQNMESHLKGSKHLAKVHTTEPDLSRLENNNSAPKKSQEISESEASNTGNKFRKRKCSLCQVTAESEITWNSHLQGQRHTAALEMLKAKKQQLKKAACEAKNQASKTKVAPEDKRSGMPVQGPKNYAGSSKSDQKLQQEIMKNKYVELTGANKWRCTICNASCNSLNNINSHLKGRRHLANIG